MKLLDNHIKDKKFSNTYVLYSDEDYLKSKYEKKLIDAILDTDFKEMNFDTFEGKNFSVTSVIDACDTLPFMSSYRIVIVKNSFLLHEGRKAESELLEKYLHSIPQNTILIFLEEKIDKKLKINKTLAKIGTIHNLKVTTDDEIVLFINSLLFEHNKSISKSDAIYFIKNVSSSIDTIINEINKLISFTEKREKITSKDIDLICTKSIESKVFDVVNFMTKKDTEKAINIYKNLILNKTSPIAILNLIARQFRVMLQVKYLYNRGYDFFYIASELSLREFIVKENYKQSQNYTIKKIVEILNECLEVDNNIKMGKVKEDIAVEMLIMKYS